MWCRALTFLSPGVSSRHTIRCLKKRWVGSAGMEKKDGHSRHRWCAITSRTRMRRGGGGGRRKREFIWDRREGCACRTHNFDDLVRIMPLAHRRYMELVDTTQLFKKSGQSRPMYIKYIKYTRISRYWHRRLRERFVDEKGIPKAPEFDEIGVGSAPGVLQDEAMHIPSKLRMTHVLPGPLLCRCDGMSKRHSASCTLAD